MQGEAAQDRPQTLPPSAEAAGVDGDDAGGAEAGTEQGMQEGGGAAGADASAGAKHLSLHNSSSCQSWKCTGVRTGISRILQALPQSQPTEVVAI